MEENYDFVLIYDGWTDADLIAHYSGFNLPPEFESTTHKMIVKLFTDSSYVETGFQLDIDFEGKQT